MIRRAAHEAARERRPRLQRLAAFHHLLVAARHLPAAVDPAVGAVRLERHQLEIFRTRLKIVERRRRAHRIAEGLVLGDVGNELAVEIDGAAVLQRLDMLGARFAVAHGQLH